MTWVRDRKHSSLAFVWMYGCGDELIRMPVSFPYAVDVPVPGHCLSAEKRHYLPLDPGRAGANNVANDNFSRYCVQMLHMCPNATSGAADERPNTLRSGGVERHQEDGEPVAADDH